MIPSTQKPTEEFEKILEEKTSGLNNKIDQLAKTIESSNKARDEKPREEKVDDILSKIKAKQSAQERGVVEKNNPEKKEEHNHEDILCPGCHKGHIHKMVGDGLKVKCTGIDCGDEFALVPIQADAECKDCKFPLKIPKNAEIVNNDPVIKAHAPGMSCPNCGGSKAVKLPNTLTFNFSKFATKK